MTKVVADLKFMSPKLAQKRISQYVLSHFVDDRVLMKDFHEPVRIFYKIICTYMSQPETFHLFLQEKMFSKYFARRSILYDYQEVVKAAIFVSSGYLLIYGFDKLGDRQLIGVLNSGSILFGKSFTHQFPSELELVVLPGTYLMMLSHADMMLCFKNFEGVETVVRLIMADFAELQHVRVLELKGQAEEVILQFYKHHAEFLHSGLLLDVDLSSYLLIGEQTLRNVRMKLLRERKL